jgi:aromatic ring-cleaving dioxygenase
MSTYALTYQNSENSTAMAMDVRERFMAEFRVRNECTVEAGDTAPQQHTICYFTPDTGPAGPFVTAQYSFFIPKGYYRMGETFAWIMQNRGSLDSFVHPNSGCATKDHTEWSLWGGNKWELDASIFHS